MSHNKDQAVLSLFQDYFNARYTYFQEIKSDVKPERKRKEKSSELAQLYADMDTNGDTPTPSSSRSLRGTVKLCLVLLCQGNVECSVVILDMNFTSVTSIEHFIFSCIQICT